MARIPKPFVFPRLPSGQPADSAGMAGFTFIEVLISLGILSIIIVVIFFLYSDYGKIFTTQQALVSVSGSARNAIDEIQTETLSASSVLPSFLFASGTYTSGTSTLVLQLPAIDGSGNTLSGKSDYVAFYANGSHLYETLQPDPLSARVAKSKQLSDTLSALTFTYNDSDFANVTSVNVDIVTQTVARSQVFQAHLQEQINLRNN